MLKIFLFDFTLGTKSNGKSNFPFRLHIFCPEILSQSESMSRLFLSHEGKRENTFFSSSVCEESSSKRGEFSGAINRRIIRVMTRETFQLVRALSLSLSACYYEQSTKCVFWENNQRTSTTKKSRGKERGGGKPTAKNASSHHPRKRKKQRRL